MSQENVEIVRRWWEGFNEDGYAFRSCCVTKRSKSGTRRTFRSAVSSRGMTAFAAGVTRCSTYSMTPRVEPDDIVDVHATGRPS